MACQVQKGAKPTRSFALKLTQIFVDGAQCTVTIELCARVALMYYCSVRSFFKSRGPNFGTSSIAPLPKFGPRWEAKPRRSQGPPIVAGGSRARITCEGVSSILESNARGRIIVILIRCVNHPDIFGRTTVQCRGPRFLPGIAWPAQTYVPPFIDNTWKSYAVFDATLSLEAMMIGIFPIRPLPAFKLELPQVIKRLS
ncbi:hypothetical protein B0H14DRAFT_2605917 [Mycena olivaceomarginata]|nr:hypothetical protein B0H14DRAFT_2605917 [Mycena olivaceomarginata]